MHIDATNKHIPLRKLSRKEMKLKSKPWITKGLLKSISTKNKLFQQCYKQNNFFLVAKYKSYFNTLTKIKEIAKRNYYQNEVATHRGDLAKQWKIINEIICHKKASNEVISMLMDHHKCNITNEVKIANLFNELFTNVGTLLDSKISRTRIKKCNVPSIVQLFFYEPITSAEVLMQFRQINAFKASGPENVPNKFYKLLASIIFPYLSNIFNACYENGYFPAVLKCAKIIPLHKSGSRYTTNNYRPISVLSTIFKVFEKLLYVRLEKFLRQNNAITKHRFGFRQGYSTDMAVADFYSMLQRNNGDGYFTCCIFLDLSKAFDTVNHNILLNKLEKYGIRSNMHQLFCSYLNNRKQYTECNSVKSDSKTVLCGVPQGSTLGPLLLSLYANDLPLHTKFYVYLFAHDTVLMMKDKNISNLQIAVNQELCDVDNWMRYNRLSLNFLKSSFISTTKHKQNCTINFCVNVGDHTIPCLESAKHLVAMIDKQLT